MVGSMTATSKRVREGAIVLGTLLFGIIALRMSAKNPGELSTLDRGVLRLVSPAQSAMSYAARGIAGVAGRFVELAHARAENHELARENARLRAEVAALQRLADETARYQRLLGLRDQTPAETIAARIISIDASPYFRVARVELDRGEGVVKRGMPVLTPEGVVGRIGHISGHTSDIMLLVDPRSAIDIVVPRTGGRGILRGKSSDNGYRCSIEYLTRGNPAQVGDKVVTSGLGGAFPRDLSVGHVTTVLPGAVGLFQEVEVTPDVDFARLSEVLVVAAPPPAADPDAGTHRSSAPARGPMVYR
jgi:rod shape-determining protein MreC